MPQKTTPALATSPLKGMHDIDRIKRFAFPPSMNFNRLAGALSPMRSLLNQAGSRNERHSNRGDDSHHGGHHSSNMMSPQRPPVNSMQHVNRQSQKYMDSASLRANGHTYGPSMGGMISPQRPPVDIPYYDRNTSKYIDSANLRPSVPQYGVCNSASVMPSSQRSPVSASGMDLNALVRGTSPQHGAHGSRYTDSSHPQMNGHSRGQCVNDMSSPQPPLPNHPQYGRHNRNTMLSTSRLPISTTAPNPGQLATQVSRLSNSHSTHSYHSTRTIDFHSRVPDHRLRRSVHSIDLRSYATTTFTPSNENVQSSISKRSGGGIEISLTASALENSYTSSYSSDLTYGPSYDRLNGEEDEMDTKKIENWILTARTGNGEWPRSPLTPRPFTSQELGGRISYYETAHDTHLYQKDDPNGVSSEEDGEDDIPRPPIRARQPNPLQAINPIRDLDNEWLPPGKDEDDAEASFAALTIMHRAQEQVRLGVELPPPSPVGAYKIDRTMRGSLEAVASEGPDRSAAPILEPSPPTKIRKKGDPLKPSPLILQLNVTENLAVRDNPPPRSDSQTYTAKGLAQVLYKLHTPGHLPPDVLAALPSAEQLTSLSNPTTPAGALAFTRTYHSPNPPTELSSKERNYVAYYIDTLLARNNCLVQSIVQLEEDVEDAEVSKAGLQEQINKWFFDARKSNVRVQTLETFIEDLVVNVVPEDKKVEARGVAMTLGVEIGYVGADAAVKEAGTKEELVSKQDEGADAAVKEAGTKEELVSKRDEKADRRTKRLEEEVKYWKARAEAAETFVEALG